MTGLLSFDPVELVQTDSRLFIDTNVFMDTDPRHQGGLKSLFERITPAIQQGGSPVVVPMRVVEELTKQGGLDPANLEGERVGAVKKAANALVFLRAAEAQGLVRSSLGEETNPYADDLFVRLFEAYSEQYAMMLITNDITLLLRINTLGVNMGQWLAAGRLMRDGTIECDAPQALYERGLRKLRNFKGRVERGTADLKDQKEIASLEISLAEYQAAFGTVDSELISRKTNTPRGGRHSQVLQPSASEGAFTAHTELVGADDLLRVAEVPGEGDEVLLESLTGDQTLRLAEKVGEGGEGSVYSVSDSHVVKIFDSEHITRHREEKIKLLASRASTEPGICFPQAVVKNLDGDFVGYMMPRAKGNEFSKVIFSPRRFRKALPNWTKADLVDVAISFLERVSYLHSLNIILGDINPKNLLVDANKDVWIIDADSWQLEGYPCPVGTEMFSAPAVIGQHYSEFLRSPEDERFAVATMLFMILITGQFPYARSGSDGDIAQLIREGNFAFQFEGNSNQDQPAGNWKYMWSHVQKGLKGLFWHTFHRDGDRYNDRPTDSEWLQAFREYRRYLSSTDNFDPMSNDVYPTRFKAMAADTPIYECAGCRTSLAGIWNGNSKSYVTPRFCLACKSSLPRCLGCGKHKHPKALTAELCYDCNRKLNFAPCTNCAQEKPKKSLVDERCYDCNQGICSDCGRGVPKHYLSKGLCDRCEPAACKDCDSRFKRSQMSYGRCPSCHQRNEDSQARRRHEQAERRKRDQALDPSRLCTRCGKPFITYGNTAWHERNSRPIPTTHKRGPGNVYLADCVPLPPTQTRSFTANTTSSTPKSNTGCFVATAAYGSYDCPEVWVLRRWRDSRLLRTDRGRALVRAYYAISPGLVDRLGDKAWLMIPTRRLLDLLVGVLMRAGITDQPYHETEQGQTPFATLNIPIGDN